MGLYICAHLVQAEASLVMSVKGTDLYEGSRISGVVLLLHSFLRAVEFSFTVGYWAI